MEVSTIKQLAVLVRTNCLSVRQQTRVAAGYTCISFRLTRGDFHGFLFHTCFAVSDVLVVAASQESSQSTLLCPHPRLALTCEPYPFALLSAFALIDSRTAARTHSRAISFCSGANILRLKYRLWGDPRAIHTCQ